MDHLAKGGTLTRHDDLLCFPDSLIVTTEVFDEFMADNDLQDEVLAGCRQEIGLDELWERIVAAAFPSPARKALSGFLEKELRPLVVRSSSVMEDDQEHSFAGIYLSEFLSNTARSQKGWTRS